MKVTLEENRHFNVTDFHINTAEWNDSE